MAAEDLPKFDDKKTYLLSGKTLNQLVSAIKANRILSIEGREIERTPEGIHIKSR